MGEVFSHAKGFTTLAETLPSLGFHAVCMALGLFCIVRGSAKRPAIDEGKSDEQA